MSSGILEFFDLLKYYLISRLNLFLFLTGASIGEGI